MEVRVARHRAERGSGWTLIEEPIELAATLRQHARPGATVVIDCLTLWLSNLGNAGRDVADEIDELVRAVSNSEGRIILVSNELGMGLHPETELSRTFRDAHGRMNQRMADCVDRVELVVAGQVLAIKSSG